MCPNCLPSWTHCLPSWGHTPRHHETPLSTIIGSYSSPSRNPSLHHYGTPFYPIMGSYYSPSWNHAPRHRGTRLCTQTWGSLSTTISLPSWDHAVHHLGIPIFCHHWNPYHHEIPQPISVWNLNVRTHCDLSQDFKILLTVEGKYVLLP